MTNPHHIVVVDDEPGIREIVQEYLESRGYVVTQADGGPALRRIVDEQPVDLVLLDINMPGEDGLTLARYLRDTSDIGVIMLTAAGAPEDRVAGLDRGADDYLAKPVDLRELLARVKSVLRRLTFETAGSAGNLPRRNPELAFGAYRLRIDTRKMVSPEGDEIPLTSMEYDLLKAFADNPNRVLSRDELLNLAHHRGWDPFDRSIDIRIARIRRKIEEDPGNPKVITTVRGAGYRYTPAVADI